MLLHVALAGPKGLGEDTLRESLLFLETKVRTSLLEKTTDWLLHSLAHV